MKYRFYKQNGNIAGEFLALSVAHPSCNPEERPSDIDRQSWRRPKKKKAAPPTQKPLILRPVPLTQLLVPSTSNPRKEAAPRPILPRTWKKAGAPVPSPRVMLHFLSRKYRVSLFTRLVLDHLRLVIAVDNDTSSLVRLEYVPECRSFLVRELLIRGEVLIGGSLISPE